MSTPDNRRAPDNPDRSGKWQTRVRRQWPAIAVYLLAAGATVLAAAWTMATDPGPFAAVLLGAAIGNAVCAVAGIRLLVMAA